MVVLERSVVARRLATARNIASPAAWPRRSLTTLKSSRSSIANTNVVPFRVARASACSTRSWKRARFGRPVNVSWNAWWVSCSSMARRSVTSRIVRTTPVTLGSSRRLLVSTSKKRYRPSACRTRQSAVEGAWEDLPARPTTSACTFPTSSGCSRSERGVPRSSLTWWPSSRSNDGVPYVIRPSSSATTMISEEFWIMPRNCSWLLLLLSSSANVALPTASPTCDARVARALC